MLILIQTELTVANVVTLVEKAKYVLIVPVSSAARQDLKTAVITVLIWTLIDLTAASAEIPVAPVKFVLMVFVY